MTAPQNRQRWLFGGGAGCLILISLCIVGLWLYFIGWDQFISPVARPPAPAPQPVAVISTQNAGKLELLYRFTISDSIHTLAWSPDSRSLAIGAGQFVSMMGSTPGESLHLWDVANGKGRVLFAVPLHNGPLQGVAFSPDGKLLAFPGDKSIELWDVPNDRELQTLTSPNNFALGTLAFSSDGKSLAAFGGDQLKTWDVATGKELSGVPITSGGAFVTLSPDWKLVAANYHTPNSQTQQLKLFDAASGKELRTIPGFPQVAFSNNDKVIASHAPNPDASKQGNGQLPLSLSDAETGQVVRALDGNVFYTSCISFSPDDTLVSSENYVWDVSSGKKFQIGGPAGCVAFSPDGRFLASGANDGTVRLWGIKP